MKQPDRELILASASPRRRELLASAGLRCRVDVSQADEAFSGAPENMVLCLSERKAKSVAPRHPHALILSADTTVAIDGRHLGKPKDREDAAAMLKMLSGRWHTVYTGVCLYCPETAWLRREACATRVHFVPVPEEEMRAYLDTSEPYDKAGAYAIQGAAGAFIDRIEGSYSNVVGLPLHTVLSLLRAFEDGGDRACR